MLPYCCTVQHTNTLHFRQYIRKELHALDIDNLLTGCVDGDIHPLIGGVSTTEGLVEVCTEGGFFMVDLGSFTIAEASVICSQLDLGSGKTLNIA